MGVKVSILVITYNQESLVEETLESCLTQTFDDFEIVVSDDGSTDTTPALLRDIQNKYPERVRLVLNPVNRGITANCNAGLAACSGELVALMGGDDLLAPSKLIAQVAEFDGDDELVLSYHPCRILRDGALGEVVGDRRKDRVESLNDMVAKFGAQMPGPATMVRASAIPSFGFREELATASDWMFFIDVASQGKVRRIDDVLGVYRQHGGNVGQRYFSYTHDFIRTLDLTRRDYGGRAGVLRAVNRGGRRFLLGVIYRAIQLGDPALARDYVSKLPGFGARWLVPATRVLIWMPGADVALGKAKALLKRYV